MLFETNKEAFIPFLLVEQDCVTPAARAQNIKAEYFYNEGDVFEAPVYPIGRGWYYAIVPPQPNPTWIVMVAQGDGTMEWRDIHQFVPTVGLIAQPGLLRVGTA